MATPTSLPPISRVSGASLALTINRLYTQKPIWAREAEFYTPAEARLLICPALTAAFFYDGTTYTDIRPAVSDPDALTATFNSMPTTGFCYLISQYQFNRFRIDVTNTNSTVSTMTVTYWNGSAWTGVSNFSDGTALSSATLGQDGEVTWDLPTDEATTTLTISGTPFTGWIIRFAVSVTLDATVSIDQIILGGQGTSYAYVQPGIRTFNLDRAAGFISLVDAATATARVSWSGYSG
jgi:hypothetical protein